VAKTVNLLWSIQQYKDFFDTVDLVVTGPNVGTNLGVFVYSLSGTCGAAYASVMYGVPAIAFSDSSRTQRPYFNITDSPYDTSILGAELAANLVSSLADGWDRSSGKPLLPLTTGLNVNFPTLNESCSSPPFVLSRESGHVNCLSG
jgi:5'-nucleotidase